MSDDEPDPNFLAFLRQHFAGKLTLKDDDAETGVLAGAEAVVDDSIDVAIVMRATKNAAAAIHNQMKLRDYSPATWAAHELHPTVDLREVGGGGEDGDGDGNNSFDGEGEDESNAPDRWKMSESVRATVAFVFTTDLLNFSFWSDRPREEDQFGVEYGGKVWRGYWSLVAALRRASDEGIPITSPDFWQSRDECTLDVLRHVFRSCTDEEMPMLEERLACLREAGDVLYEKYDCHPVNLVLAARSSAARLVNLLASDFSCFRDEAPWPAPDAQRSSAAAAAAAPRTKTRTIRFLKRAQIFAADVWACFAGLGPGAFADIGKITMFADYRVPQMLNTLGCLYYSPKLAAAITAREVLPPGHSWEMQLRACSIWCVELIRREIVSEHPDARVNAVLIDFFLYDTVKEMEAEGKEVTPHHRTRSIWY